MNDSPGRRAAEWLDRTYGGLVTLTDSEPLLDGERTQLFSCGYADGFAPPMLASTIAVPKDGGQPFPVANADPLDEELNGTGQGSVDPEPWRWRANARGCVVATDVAIDHVPSSAVPWMPWDEEPGWWDRLLAAHFPDSEVSTCSTWGDVASMLLEGGAGTRSVVWLRRQFAGREITGHLLYAFHDGSQAVFVDGQRGTLARLNDEEVRELVVARFHRELVERGEEFSPPWEIPAPDLEAARDKASSWLEHTYSEPIALVRPAPEDETERGWLFACTTERFQETGDWREQMLDAALVVPKEAGEEPFGLPNNDPWTYLDGWDARREGIGLPPAPGDAAWFEPTMRQLGEPLSTTAHPSWGEALTELTTMSKDSKAVVWIRRADSRGTETVGNLLIAINDDDGIRLIDGMAEDGQPTFEQNPLAVHVIRYQ